MKKSRWLQLMLTVERPDSIGVFDSLFAAYSQSHRRYHTVTHVSDCLGQLDETIELAEYPAEVELALWFHDAIYKPMRSDNEFASANWSRSFLQSIGMPSDSCERVFAHIMDTCHHSRHLDGDAALVVDIDLSILGSGSGRYDLFETQIRQEYRWVPMPAYRTKRCEILESFLDRPAIYQTDWFRRHREQPARDNLQRAINQLRR